MKVQNQGFDHVEFVVKEFADHRSMYERMGFEKIGERSLPERGIESEVWAQGFIRIMLTRVIGAAGEKEQAARFWNAHGDGVCVLALDVPDASVAFEEAVGRGARPALEPVTYEGEHGRVVRAEIWTPEDVRYAFIQRHAPGGEDSTALFDEGLDVARLKSPSPLGFQLIDHLTNNIPIGAMDTWRSWYKDIFGFIETREFNISTGRTGLLSYVVESPCGKIKVPINEATEPESQVQEFVDRFKGAGVQHLALLTTDIMGAVSHMGKNDYEFLKVPHTYYEAVPTRVPNVEENLEELEKLQILLDGDDTGYLLQIFTAETVGPFFFEVIQRKGNRGFGEGNFKALFEAIERDQVDRGVLEV